MYKKYLKSFYLKHLISSARYLKSPAVENHYWFILMSNLTPNKKKKYIHFCCFPFFFFSHFIFLKMKRVVYYHFHGCFFFPFLNKTKKNLFIHDEYVCLCVCVCVDIFYLLLLLLLLQSFFASVLDPLVLEYMSYIYIYLFTLFFCYFTDWWHTHLKNHLW